MTIPKEEHDRVIYLFERYSPRELAKLYKVDHKTILRLLNKHGINTGKIVPEKRPCNLCIKKIVKRKRNSVLLCSAHYQNCRRKELCLRCGMSLRDYPDRKSSIKPGYCDSCDKSETESEFSGYQSPTYRL